MAYNSSYTGAEVEEILGQVADKADSSNVYTKSQATSTFYTKTLANSTFCTLQQVKNLGYSPIYTCTQKEYDEMLDDGEIEDDAIYIITS